MKRNILILFAVVSLIISLTGCGSSGSSNSVAPIPSTMTSVRVSLTQNGEAVTGAEAALYTPDAAMREGLTQAQNNALLRASIGESNLEGVYKPTSTSADGTYTFNVPAGEYTLIAGKGNSKAVVTSIRAATSSSEEQEGATLKYELTPTGTINGKVVSNVTGLSVAGVIVYLNGTSFAAITKSDGSFSMSGVPQDTFNISAVSSQNGKTYAASLKQVVMPSELVKNDVEIVLAEASSSKTYKITGSITGNDKANKVIMASNGSNIFVVTSRENGSFEIAVNTKGQYSVTCFGAVEPIQTIDVTNDTNTLSSSFLVNKSEDAYGSVKGNIIFSSDYNAIVTDSNVPDVDRYLVQLIGVDGTVYRTQTRADYKGKTSPSGFMFDGVYPGTYTIFVDPAGNGFLGSIGTFTVKVGETTDLGKIATAAVTFVQPIFTAFVQENTEIVNDYPVYQLVIKEKCPFLDSSNNNLEDGFLKNPIAYCRVIGDNETPRDAYLKPILDINGVVNGYELSYKDDPALSNPLTKNGKYEIVLQFQWSDSNLGLKGTLIGTQVVNYTSDPYSEIIGDVIVRKKNLTEGDFPGVQYCPKLNYCDGYISGGYYNDDGEPVFFWLIGDGGRLIDSNLDTLAISGTSILYEEGETISGGSLKYIEDTSLSNYQAQAKEIPYEDDTSRILEGAALLYKKYLCVYYSLSGTAYAKVFEYGNNPDNPFSNQVATYTMSGYGIRGVALAESPSGKCYTAILYEGNPQEIVKIYDIAENVECASYSLSNPAAIGILNFQALLDGSFYIEFEPSDDGGNTSMKSVRLISGTSYEESNLMNRKSCFMDKHGFMYRVDTLTNCVIKTSSLDGKPLETYKILTDDGNTGSIYEPLNGILGLATVDYEDSPVLFVW